MDLPLKKRLFVLFYSTLYINAIAFGGGFVVIPLLRKQYVEKYAWVSEDDLTDLIALSQSAPGTIAGNFAMLIGHHIAGFWGAFVTLIASIIPATVIITFVAYFYHTIRDNILVERIMRGMQAGVVTVILDLAIQTISRQLKMKKAFITVILCTSFVASYLLDISVIVIILVGAAAGIVHSYYLLKREA